MDIKNTLIQELFKFIINGQNIQKNRGLLNSNNNKRKRQIKGDKGGIKTVWGILDKDKRPWVKWDKELKVSEN